MNENLTSRITGKLGGLSDEMGRQLLDYIEFLESKYNRSSRTPSTVQRLAENIEDRIGGGKLMEGLAAASKVVAEELATAPPTKGNGQQAEAPATDETPSSATDEAPSSADDASAGEEQQEPPEEPPAPA
jgi:hypothetical protein